MVRLFEDSNFCALYGKQVTVDAKDIRLAMILRGEVFINNCVFFFLNLFIRLYAKHSIHQQKVQ